MQGSASTYSTRALRGSLTDEGMRAWSAPKGIGSAPLARGDGTDVAAEASGVGGDRDQHKALRQGRERPGLDELCDDRVASSPTPTES